MRLDDLKDALEGRGFLANSDQTPSLAGLLPLFPETDAAWLGRRAATELAVDPDLRFIRYQNMVLPDKKTGQALEGLNISSAIAEVAKLLDPQQGKEDPLAAMLKQVGDRGRVGTLVTRLDIAPDMSQVTVEAVLWVRAGDRWVPYVAIGLSSPRGSPRRCRPQPRRRSPGAVGLFAGGSAGAGDSCSRTQAAQPEDGRHHRASHG